MSRWYQTAAVDWPLVARESELASVRATTDGRELLAAAELLASQERLLG
jgi:hypothetical protein